MREAPSRVIIDALARARRARSSPTIRWRWTRRARVFGDAPRLAFATSPMDALRRRRRAGHRHRVEGVPQPGLRRAARARCKQPLIFDGRNLYEPARGARGRASSTSPSAGAERPRERASASRRGAIASRTARVLVVGDVMLDRYWFGDVERISPEAPVPVVQDRAHRGAPRRRGQRRAQRGRARRAGRRCCRWSATTRPGAALAQLLGRRARADVAACATPTLPTTVKLRVIGRQQQLLRIDFETAPSHEVLAAKLADYERLRRRRRRRRSCPTTARAGSRTSRR